MVSNELLRRDVRMLGDLLGEVIAELAGPASLELVEQIRRLARERRSAATDADQHLAEEQLAAAIATLSPEQARVVARAFSVFFDLSNLAEDRHRVRVLRSRQHERHPEPVSESIGAAIVALKAAGMSAEQVQTALDGLAIELVFTAHPSEAKRRSIRGKIRRMRQLLEALDQPDLLPRELVRYQQGLRTELSTLWQTEFLRPTRPTVLQEVERGLSITPRIATVVPLVFDALRQALKTQYPEHRFRIPRFLRFGSWIGGDRDGNPNVTWDITAQTLIWLRESAVRLHIARSMQMYELLSISLREIDADHALERRLTSDTERWPDLAEELSKVAPREIYRRWISMIQWRLRHSFATLTQSAAIELSPLSEGAYRDGTELELDVQLMRDSLSAHHGEALADGEVEQWLDLVRVFGLHLARLDVRQDSRRYLQVMDELFKRLGVVENFIELPEAERQAALSTTLGPNSAVLRQPLPGDLSPLCTETLQLFRLLHRAIAEFGDDSIGGHVISLTHAPSDVLTVLWLWRWAQHDAIANGKSTPSGAMPTATSGQAVEAGAMPTALSEHALNVGAMPTALSGHALEAGAMPTALSGHAAFELRIIPLFEQIGDLRDSPQTVDAILSHPDYREHLRRQGDRQIIMVGYSDSTKDGGYLAACWGLYRAQSELHAAADRHNVSLTFFHGRGGSLGRGGGPAARGIISLPPAALDGTLRLTEQGEVLAERYDDEQIAYRHLEQVTWATLLGSALPNTKFEPSWLELLPKLSRRSFEAYRALVDQPGFIRFFELATPIEEIENLPIGSRPSRRRGERSLTDLRAIPWVFSWTQNRCMIPAWYGLGSALIEVKNTDPANWQKICDMYQHWPFWAATIDNASLALAKADMVIAQRYAELTDDAEARERIWQLIVSERDRTRQALLEIVGSTELLSSTPWFQGSIEVRNPYIDPLNLIQIDLLRRRREMVAGLEVAEQRGMSGEQRGVRNQGEGTLPITNEDELRDLLRLTVQGIAAGMRTTG